MKTSNNPLTRWMHHEAAPGLTLMAAALVAVIIANTPLADVYASVLNFKIGFETEAFSLKKGLILWINDGLMAIFFLLVGLEIKRERVKGALRVPSQVILPAMAAVGGMAIPALIFAGINWGDAVAIRGWAIPAATDIAFALCVLSLVGSRAPLSLKVFLTTVAVLDDLGAIVIIAAFYTAEVKMAALGVAGVSLAALIALNRFGVRKLAPYLLIGFVMWLAVLKSGVHATLAGVMLAFTIPVSAVPGEKESPLEHLEHALHPWVSFAVLPIFGFANAGVSFAGMSLGTLAGGVPLGIVLGLFVGKLVGILGMSWLTVKLGFAGLPKGASWSHMLGVAWLCGIGFTMSLFIGGLAYETNELETYVRLGVIVGSLFSGILGFAVLRFIAPAAAEDRVANA